MNQHFLPADKEKLTLELKNILCSGSTALYDTLCSIKKNMEPNDYLFLLTDGEDTSSKKFNKTQYESDILELVT